MSLKDYRLGYRSDIEGLRAVAILFVVGVHAGLPWLSGGFVGVDIFFVLSGFLITGLLLRDAAGEGRLNFLDFYVRRLRRLLPALIVMLLVTSGLAMLLLAPAEQVGQASAGAAAALWLSNIHFAFSRLNYFASLTETNIFLHTWSLGVEEQFYLLWPALLVWLLGLGGLKGIARVKVGLYFVLLVSLVATVLLTYKAPQLAFYMMPLRAWQFSAGALVWLYFSVPKKAEANARSAKEFTPLWQLGGWAGLALVVIAALAFDSSTPYPGVYAVIPTVGAVLIVAGGSGGASRGVSRLLSWQPLQAIGHLSYSWYLWHWPILLLGHALTGSDSAGYRFIWVLLSLVLAAISYRYIETPIRHQQRWLAHGRTTVLAAIGVMVLVNVLCIYWYNHASVRMHDTNQQRYSSAHADAPVIYGMGCDDWYRSDRVQICAFGPANATHTAVLMGDSIAGQWFPTVASVFYRPDWRLLVLTKSSCPMVDIPFFYARIGREYTECSTWRRNALARVAALKPAVVILSTVGSDDFTQAQWVGGTASALSAIAPYSGHIYILRDTPHLPFDGPDCVAMHVGRPRWFGFKSMCTAPSQGEHEDQVYAWLKQAASKFDNTSTIDMNNFICPNGTCSAERSGSIIFRDSQHMTGTFAESLAPAFERQLDLQRWLPAQKLHQP